MEALNGWWDDFYFGSIVIAKVFFFSFFLTIAIGLIGASVKLSGRKIPVKIANAYTVIFRGTPEILVLLLLYFGSAITLTSIAQVFNPEVKFVDLPPFWAGVLAISLVVGAYATETFRGAFLGVSPGSVEAARALGLSDRQTFFYIKLPEMWRLALPPFGNHSLSLIKDTALISIIGLNETLFVAKQATAYTGKPFTMYIVVGIIYLAYSTIVTLSFMGLERVANRHLMVSK
jgi:arginine/ornithine transport system permease protein